MALGYSEPQYELVNGKKKYVQSIIHIMVLIGLAILVMFVVILMLYVFWLKFKVKNDENSPMDFVLFGPQKYSNSDVESYRAQTFAIAAKSDWTFNWTAKYEVDLNIRVEKTYNLACYYSIPTHNTSETLHPAQINATLCTHLIVAFAQVQNNTVFFKSLFDIEILKQVVELRNQNSKLKILLSIIHFSNGSHSNEGFSGVVSNKENLNKFVNSVVSVVNIFKLDGIDIDWEFPSWPLLNLEEKYGFSKLLQVLRSQLPDLLLTAAVAAPLNIINYSYEVYSLASFVDFINVMAYDFHSFHWYYPLTGPNSPLFSSKNDFGYFKNLNINASIQYWLSKGMPKKKILLGMPTYGHSFKLINEANNGFGSPASDYGIGKAGYVTFTESCKFISQKKATTIFDHETRTPYSYYKKNWISFDNDNSLAYKAEFVTSLDLGGAMIFSLNTDDFTGSSTCASVLFPLTSRVQLVLNDDNL